MRSLAAVLLLFTSPLFAQDYLVTTRGDTVRGKFSISTYETTDKVLVSQPKKKKTEIIASSILSIVLDSSFYRAVRIPDAYRIMRIGRNGMLVSLCYARQSPGTPFDVPYLVKVTGESMQITSLRFRKSVSSFLRDCPSIISKFENDEIGKKDLDKIIDEYNHCFDHPASRPVVVSAEDPVMMAVSKMTQRFQADASVPSDAVDILKDIHGKVREGKAVPNYLADGLKKALSSRADYQDDLEALLKLLNK